MNFDQKIRGALKELQWRDLLLGPKNGLLQEVPNSGKSVPESEGRPLAGQHQDVPQSQAVAPSLRPIRVGTVSPECHQNSEEIEALPEPVLLVPTQKQALPR